LNDPRPVAVITGGKGDLAKALVSRFEENGYEVLAPGRDELDVLSAESVGRYFGELSRIDVLINNAGITRDGLFLKQMPTDWNTVIDTCLKGSHLCSQKAALLMLRQRSGHIINVGSFSGEHPPIGQTAYAAAKAALIALTKSYAAELGKRNICVNCLLPGFLETNMTKEMTVQARDAALKRHALARFTTLKEAAEQIHFLADCKNISGQVFQLDSRV